MALLFSINILTEYILIARPNSAEAGKESIFLHKKFLSTRYTQRSFLDCKHKHMIKSGGHLTKLESCTISYLQKSMVSQAELISKGYHSLVPGLT